MSDPPREIRRPILIVGSPRSGTTMLGKLLSQHPDIAYWEEPRPIWSQGNAWRDDDRLVASDLTPAIAKRIDRRFSRFLADSGRVRFAEKTPSNTLRLPFLHALYPDARIVHLVRDGRAVVASMRRMLEKPPDRGRVLARLRETPWRDLPALAPLVVRDVLRPRFSGEKQKSWWGPRPPEWREWLDLPTPIKLARQWRTLVTTAREDLRSHFPREQWIEVRYEDFVRSPEEWLRAIGKTLELPVEESLLEQALAEIRPTSLDAWKSEFSREVIDQIESEIGGDGEAH